MKKNRINIIITFFLFVIISSYIILSSSAFNSKNIIVTGNENITKEEIIYISQIKENRNIFQYNLRDVQHLIEENNYVEKAIINRKLPDTISIEIIEKEISAVLKNENLYCYIDEESNIIDIIDEDKAVESDFLTIEVNYSVEEDGTIKVINDSESTITNLLKSIKNEKMYNIIVQIMVKEDIINIYSENNVEFTMNKEEDIEYSIKQISQILIDLQSKNITGGSVDLTSNDYAIYKP